MSEALGQVANAQALSKFLAKKISEGSAKGTVSEEELASRISEIELQTQISGASFIKVQIIDPEWTLQTSGFVDVNDEGFLNDVEVEFPEGSGWLWTFCAVEGSTEVGSPNFTMTFEDKIIADLRQYWGPKQVPPKTQTRAQFIRALINEVGQHGEPKIKFVCPSLNVKQPVEKKQENGVVQSKTAAHEQQEEEKQNKTRGVGAGAAITIKGAKPSATQLALINEVMGIANGLNAGPLATEALIEACIAENDFTNNPGGGGGSSGLLQLIPSTAASLGISQLDVKGCVEAFLQKGFGGNGGAIAYAKAHPGAPAYEVAQAVQASGAGEASKGASNYGVTAAEAKAIIQAAGGVTLGNVGASSAGGGESDVGQLQRGTEDNPDEDSYECITRLAQQVNWFAFTNGQNFFYEDGKDLARQKPTLYLDIPRNHIIDGHTGKSEYGALLSPSTYTFDNTSFEYRKTHKLKTKVLRRSKAIKPSTPSEVRLSIVCDIDTYRAGDVVVIQNSGPPNGRWIVSDVTRNCLKDTFSTLILEPPVEPLPEPKATNSGTVSAGEASGSANAVVAAAKKALAEKSKYRYVYGGGRGAGASLFEAPPREMDCSSFTELCFKEAGAPDPSGVNYSPIGTTETLIAGCTKVSTPAPGDLCFFGEGSGSAIRTTHVTIYVGGGKAISMGQEGDPEEGPAQTTGPAGFLGYYRPN
jgi:cell wall-associated NlpC family hydrolase